MKIDILHEDNHLIIVNKPNAVLTHGDRTGDLPLEEMVRQYLKDKYHKQGNVFAKSTHRLDRPVSGAIIYAKTSKGHERMAKLFRERLVEKTYWALCTRRPSPDTGTVSQHLIKDRKRNTVKWVDTPEKRAREAITKYRLLAFLDPYYLIELNPLTGRSHQLRVMLRSKRCPIAGDVKYGGRKISSDQALLLHARRISFVHPVKQEPIIIEAPVPDLYEWQYVMSMYSELRE